MFLVVAKYLIPKGYRGFAAFPFVLIKNDLDKGDEVFLNHERIHLRQQLELLIVPFFIWYFMEYLVRLVQYKNGYQAYRNISFEREAYDNELDLGYVTNKPLFSFFKYVTLKKQ